MPTDTLTSSSSITNVTGYCVYSEARYGSNGDSGGAHEYFVGGSALSNSSGRMTWDQDINDGLDSGWVDVGLIAPVGGGSGGVAWTVTGGVTVPVTYTGRTYGSIQRVKIRAAVQTEAAMLWQSIDVKFYKNGSVRETYARVSGPEVDTMGAGGNPTAEQILEVVPDNSDNDKVVITGQIRMACEEGVFPDVSEIFGQIFIYAANCSGT